MNKLSGSAAVHKCGHFGRQGPLRIAQFWLDVHTLMLVEHHALQRLVVSSLKQKKKRKVYNGSLRRQPRASLKHRWTTLTTPSHIALTFLFSMTATGTQPATETGWHTAAALHRAAFLRLSSMHQRVRSLALHSALLLCSKDVITTGSQCSKQVCGEVAESQSFKTNLPYPHAKHTNRWKVCAL